MTTPAQIVAHIGFLRVGAGGDPGGASADFALLSLSEEVQRVTMGEQTAAASKIRRVWTMKSYAIAATPGQVSALQATLDETLARRGATVTVSQLGATRTMLRAAAIQGFPRVRVVMTPELSVGPVQRFDIVAETEEPIVQSGSPANLAEHDQTTEISVSAGGRETRRVRGAVRTANGTNARAWIEANVLPGVQADATTLGLSLTRRFTLGADASLCSYEFALEVPGSTTGGGSGVTEAEVTDRIEVNEQGRRMRTISGYAVGTGATAFAEGQAPADAGQLLTRSDISLPRVPDGRVQFSFSAIRGQSDARFPGAPVVSLSESVEDLGGGSVVTEQSFHGALPTLWFGPQRAYRYAQRTTVESIGALTGPPSLLFDADLLESEPTVSVSARGGIHQTWIAATFVSPVPVALPAPRWLAP